MVGKDFLAIPICLILIYTVALIYRNKNYDENNPLRKYFILGLTLKISGAIAAGLIYFYHYKDGDTLYYFDRVKRIYWLYTVDASLAFKVIFANTKIYDPETYVHLDIIRAWDTSQFMVIRIASLLSIPTFGSYYGIALMFAGLSFTGVWALFKTFVEINPKLIKEFAIACLFIPSVFFWGSGLFKDTIAIGFVGWFTRCVYMILIKRQKILPHAILLVFVFYILFVVKAYIIMAFTPSILFWVFFKYRDNIKNDFTRKIMTPVIIVVSVLGAFLSINRIGGSGEYWSLDQMTSRAKDMQWWHKEVREIYGTGSGSGGGSYYSLGSGDFSIGNIIRTFPLAVNVTLFRPYLWEARNPVMLISAIESLIILIFTLKIIFSVGIPMALRISIANPEAFFALLFSLIFAFAVGFTSFNFGALVRYKIQCIPFYVMTLYLIRYHANVLRNKGKLAVTEK